MDIVKKHYNLFRLNLEVKRTIKRLNLKVKRVQKWNNNTFNICYYDDQGYLKNYLVQRQKN